MLQEQLDRRESAAARHDAALRKWPDRAGEAFSAEMRAVVGELAALAAEIPASVPRSLEWSRTYRWLGDAYFDLARSRDRALLERGRAAYARAEALLDSLDEPIERAKMLVNSANTLRMLAEATDGALMQEALDRYGTARALFAAHDHSRVRQVDDLIQSLSGMLGMLKARDALAATPMPVAGEPVTAEQVEALQNALKDTSSAAALHAGEVGRALHRLAQGAGVPVDSTEVDALRAQLRDLGKEGGDGDGIDKDVLFEALQKRFEQDVASGRVTPERAAVLHDVMSKMAVAQRGGKTIESLMEQQEAMKRLMSQVQNLPEASHGLPRPPEGSRALVLAGRWQPIKRALGTLATRRDKGEREGERLGELFTGLAVADREIWAAGGNDAHTAKLERERLRALASEVRQMALLPHLTWARPDFLVGEVPSDPSGVFFAGGAPVRGLVEHACHRLGLTLLADSRGEETGAVRWKMLRRAGVAVFDFTGEASPTARAAVAYELGLARTAGHPIVVLCGADAALPFDIAVEPVVLQGDATDEAQITEAIDAAVYAVPVERPAGRPFVATARQVIARFGQSSETGGVALLLGRLETALAQTDPSDPVAVAASLRTVLSKLGPDAGELLTPAWPPCYPDGDRPRVFHIMPFGPDWSKPVSMAVRRLCGDAVDYVRHDDVADDHVIHSLWDEIGKATHLIVDLTDFNLNVAIELGFAHALGKPTLLVGQQGTVAHLFPSIAKRRVHEYDRSAPDGLLERVARFLQIHLRAQSRDPAPTREPAATPGWATCAPTAAKPAPAASSRPLSAKAVEGGEPCPCGSGQSFARCHGSGTAPSAAKPAPAASSRPLSAKAVEGGEPCPCGSGQSFARCHGSETALPAQTATLQRPAQTATPPRPALPVPPQRPGLSAMEQQFHAAIVGDQRDNRLAQLVTQGLLLRGVVGRSDIVADVVTFVRAYVAGTPALMAAVWRAAWEHGVAAQIDPMLVQVEAYCREPNDVFADHLGLIGVVDDAYLARRTVRGTYQRMSLFAPNPAEEQADMEIRNLIIGEPFASQLDWMVLQILNGPQVAQALQAMAAAAGAQAAWGSAVRDHEIAERVNLQMRAMGFV